jgi:tetratricopeptide (TPR) repeat protein
MSQTRLRLLAITAVLTAFGIQNAFAGDLKVTLPKHSQLTMVQRLNREGVDLVRKKQYEKAEATFYKAYLYDPTDPFTLNNLGYISELQGQLDRALKLYALAAEQGGEAFIDRSNAQQLVGKPMSAALNGVKDVPMRVNRMNVQAIGLLSENRNYEAGVLLEQALTLDPQNTFTLNNLGVAKESVGDYEEALKYYREAAAAHSKEPIVVTMNKAWRGKPVSEMAAKSARELQARLDKVNNDEARAAMLTWRGVSATNRNDWNAARQDFLKAYSLDPKSAFSLNNLGYVSEKDGDLETAQFYYDRAQRADNADARVGLATDGSAEGKHLLAVATDSDQKVDGALDQYQQARRRQAGPIQLNRRGNNPGPDSKEAPAAPASPDAATPGTPDSAPTPHTN